MASRASTPARIVEVDDDAESPHAEEPPAVAVEAGPSICTESSLTPVPIEAEHDDDGGDITRADFMRMLRQADED